MADVLVPDMGSDDPVDVAEILVKVGDIVQLEDSLVVLESAKASLEVPSPAEGKVVAIHASTGQSLNTGDVLLTLESANASGQEALSQPQEAVASAEPIVSTSTPAPTQGPEVLASVAQDADEQFTLPDIGGDAAEVIELSVQPGTAVKKDQTLLVLESAKATVEVPAEADGIVVKYLINVGESANEGTPYIVMTVNGNSSPTAEAPSTKSVSQVPAQTPIASQTPPAKNIQANAIAAGSQHGLEVNISGQVHAGPAVRRLANKLGVVLSKVSPTGPRGRILKEDVQAFVKTQMLKSQSESQGGVGLPPLPTIDFSQYGEVEEVTLTKIQHMSAQNLHRAWVNIPHVTQFDEADITDLEAFRKSLGDEYKAQGVKITMLAFMIKASTLALKKFPRFNASLHSDGKTLIQKKYCHIGFAADTPFGLVVPVIRDADQLSVVEIARQLGELSGKARDKKLSPRDMQGGCFSISSLGGIGGTAFTPIVNWPEVAILGVSRASLQPKWQGSSFEPRLMLPLSLSYDHRVIDGADAARFAQYLVKLLSDARRMLL